jgi:hypothetical protein
MREQKAVTDYAKLINHLHEIPHVRYASIADDMGQRIAGGMKPGVRSATAPEEETRLSLQSILSLKTAESYQKYTGKLQYLSISWEKMSAIFLLLPNSKSLTLTIDKKGDQSAIVKRATAIVKNGVTKAKK